MTYSVRITQDDFERVELFQCNKEIDLDELDFFIWDSLEDGYSVSLRIVDDEK